MDRGLPFFELSGAGRNPASCARRFVPLVVAYGLWRAQRWSWYGTLVVSVMLVTWIIVEIVIIGYQPQPPLQLIYGVLGCVILLLAFSPSVRAHVAGSRGITQRSLGEHHPS